ncbi:hypothetical protein WJX72_001299 [[Myrmecia] bisecta]|uniref:Tyrosine decarboxylase n=1 Tax=[Myrmecia] bisecta TaxID=41462 RepID=A0AAW1PKT3_9CHLO
MDIEGFRKWGYKVIDFICSYHQSVGQRPVRSQVEPGYLAALLPSEAPERGEPFGDLLADVTTKIMPGLTHWQSPSFFAYYPVNYSFPSMLGEMLGAGLNVIGFSWISSPAVTELEQITLDWLGKLLGLPPSFLSATADGRPGKGGGVILSTASEAVLVCLLAARARAMAGRPVEDQLRLVAYTSDQGHSCIKKACMIAGVMHCRILPTTERDDFELLPAVLQAAIEEDLATGLIPCFYCANLGSTSSCAFDPIRKLFGVARAHNIWCHVDAAYAGSMAVCPELRAGFDGLELADSFNMNPTKSLLVNWECSALWVQDSWALKLALSLTPEYLRAKANALDYKDWQVPLGTRFRALKLWFVLRSYGAQGLQAYIRHHVGLARWFADRVLADARFELAAPPKFGLVSFRLKGATREKNMELLERLNASGKLFMVHTELAGQYTLRFALGSTDPDVSTPANCDLEVFETGALRRSRRLQQLRASCRKGSPLLPQTGTS